MKDDNAPQRIIESTMELIKQSGGDVGRVTARAIASHANVSLGLINYHFGNKDNLILECTQQIISQVVSSFVIKYSPPEGCDVITASKLQLTATAKGVFEFLFANRELSRLSILGDMKDYSADSNTVHTMEAFMRRIGDVLESDERRRIASMLTATVQSAFLASFSSYEYMGYRLQEQQQREQFIESVVEQLFGRYGNSVSA
ncbi:MAG: TetR/AcrR family transcriptional regulator [bacterium]|nr:TetR/AcrR family transcriptional regulator [bacterium]